MNPELSLSEWYDDGNGCQELIDLVQRTFEVAYHRQRLISWNSTHTRDLIRTHKDWKLAKWYIWKEYYSLLQSENNNLTSTPISLEDAIDLPGLIQACLDIDCPEILLRIALHLNPNNDMMTMDPTKNHQSPLHILCSRYSNQMIHVAIQSCPEACSLASLHDRESFPLEVYLERQQRSLNQQSEEQVVDEPIQMGLMIDILLEANPGALAISDIDTRLYPRIWSRFSVKRRKGWNRKLDSQRFFGKDLCRTVLFQFIKSSPHVFGP
jgi:hypothetical protein